VISVLYETNLTDAILLDPRPPKSCYNTGNVRIKPNQLPFSAISLPICNICNDSKFLSGTNQRKLKARNFAKNKSDILSYITILLTVIHNHVCLDGAYPFIPQQVIPPRANVLRIKIILKFGLLV
jgi:hypothetical protein